MNKGRSMVNPLYDELFARQSGDAAIFLRLSDGTNITYASFLERAAQFAHAMTTMGVRPGDRLAVQIEKSPEALAVYAACAQTGVVFLPLNTAYTASEISYFLNDCKPALLLCDSAKEAALAPVAQQAGARLETLNGDGTGSFVESASDAPSHFDTVARKGDDLAALLYTSGTTGRSKGAMLTQDNLLSNAKTLKEYWQFTDQDVLLHALPIFHTHGLFVATNTVLLSRAQMIFLPLAVAEQNAPWARRYAQRVLTAAPMSTATTAAA